MPGVRTRHDPAVTGGGCGQPPLELTGIRLRERDPAGLPVEVVHVHEIDAQRPGQPLPQRALARAAVAHDVDAASDGRTYTCCLLFQNRRRHGAHPLPLCVARLRWRNLNYSFFCVVGQSPRPNCLSQAFRGTKPVSVCCHGVPEMIRCIKREIPPERFRPTSAMGTPAWSTPRPSCATRFARLVACRLMSSSESSARARNSSTLFMTWSSRSVLRQHSTSMMAAKPRRLQLRPRCLTRSAKVSTWLSAAPRPRKPSVEIPLAARRTR